MRAEDRKAVAVRDFLEEVSILHEEVLHDDDLAFVQEGDFLGERSEDLCETLLDRTE